MRMCMRMCMRCTAALLHSAGRLLAAVSRPTALPTATLGFQSKLDKGTFFWAHRYQSNIARMMYNHMIVDINALQADTHNASLKLQADLDATPAADLSSALVTARYLRNADNILQQVWDLNDQLMFKYADGWVNENTPAGFTSNRVAYPDWWFQAVNYTGGPPPVPHADRY